MITGRSLWNEAVRELVDAIVRLLHALAQVIAVMRDLLGNQLAGPLGG